MTTGERAQTAAQLAMETQKTAEALANKQGAEDIELLWNLEQDRHVLVLKHEKDLNEERQELITELHQDERKLEKQCRDRIANSRAKASCGSGSSSSSTVMPSSREH